MSRYLSLFEGVFLPSLLIAENSKFILKLISLQYCAEQGGGKSETRAPASPSNSTGPQHK